MTAALPLATRAELVLNYIDVLAWPVVVLLALFVFRGRLHDLFDRVTELGGAGFNAKFQNAARTLSTTSKSDVGAAENTDTNLPITPKVKPKAFDWSAPPPNLATFHVKHFSDVHGIVTTYEEGRPVEVDVRDASNDDRFRVLTYVAGVVRGSGGLMATDKDDSLRFAAIPPVEPDAL